MESYKKRIKAHANHHYLPNVGTRPVAQRKSSFFSTSFLHKWLVLGAEGKNARIAQYRAKCPQAYPPNIHQSSLGTSEA